jgi:SIR2-like domain
VMAKNLAVLASDETAKEVRDAYRNFLKTLNAILLRRRSTLLGKEINLFTTNIDIFLETALEEIGLEFNDGFNGRFKPVFSLGNFNTSRFKRSLHFENLSELPVFNLLKLHGSLTWIMEDKRIVFSRDLAHVDRVNQVVLPSGCLVNVVAESTLETLTEGVAGLAAHESLTTFLTAYEEILVVNPTKEKFKHTLLNQTYYELLRIYSNELEKDNSVLFVMGFSFADEHIREITLRAANSNPTLIVYVIAHSSKAAHAIRANLGSDSIKNANVHFLSPEGDEVTFDLATIDREIFRKLFPDEAPKADADPEEE